MFCHLLSTFFIASIEAPPKNQTIFSASQENPEKLGWQFFWDFFSSGHFLDLIHQLFEPSEVIDLRLKSPGSSGPTPDGYLSFPPTAMEEELEQESEAAWLHYIVLVSTQYILLPFWYLLITPDHWSWDEPSAQRRFVFADEKLQMGSRCTCQYSTRLRYRFNLCRAIPKFRAISVLGLNENRRIIEELTRILPLSSFSAAKSIIVYLAVSGCSTRLQNEWLQPQKCFFGDGLVRGHFQVLAGRFCCLG